MYCYFNNKKNYEQRDYKCNITNVCCDYFLLFYSIGTIFNYCYICVMQCNVTPYRHHEQRA